MPEAAPAVVDHLSQARAEIAAYEAANHPPVKAPVKPTDTAPAKDKADEAAPAAKEPTEAAVSTEQVTEAVNADTAPATEEAVDLSFLPEEVRAQVVVKSKEAANKIKSGWMGHAKITQGFQEIAAVKRDAENWRKAVSDPVKAKKIVAILTDEAPDPVEEEVEIDPLTLDGKGFKDLIRKEAAKLLEAERVKAMEAAAAPTRHLQTLNAAISEVAMKGEIPEATMKAAIALWKQDLAENGGNLNDVPVAAVPALLAPYLRLTRVTPGKAQTNAGAANGRAGGLAEVASPNGRSGSSAGSTIVVPEHVRLGRPAATPEEFNAEMEYAFKKRFGPDASQG